MITSLAARREALAQRAGKEAGAWTGSQRVGAGAHLLPRMNLGGWSWGLGRVGRSREEGGLPVAFFDGQKWSCGLGDGH